MISNKTVNDATFYPNYIKHTAYKRFIFDNKTIIDLKHVIDQHIASFNCYWALWLIHTYVPMDTTKNVFNSADNCDNHMGS
jgi:hypothetical protein